MNNLRLNFAGAELTQLRTLVTAVGKEIGLLPGAATPADGPQSALETSWSRLLQLLDLGTEPEMQTCPHCQQPCMMGATLCGRCWSRIPRVAAKVANAA